MPKKEQAKRWLVNAFIASVIVLFTIDGIPKMHRFHGLLQHRNTLLLDGEDTLMRLLCFFCNSYRSDYGSNKPAAGSSSPLSSFIWESNSPCTSSCSIGP